MSEPRRPRTRPRTRLRVPHEERHALGMWLMVLVLGGFAAVVWAVGTRRGPTPAPPAPADTLALSAVSAGPPPPRASGPA